MEYVKVKTPEFRGSFVNLIKPKPGMKRDDGTTGEAKYEICIVLDKDKKSTKAFIAELRKSIDAACMDKFGKKMPDGKLKNFPIKDGDNIGDEGAFEGKWFIRADSKFKPGVLDQHGEPVETEAELYSGAWYKVMVHAWAYNNEFGKGVSISLDSVLKIRDDDRFGGGSNAKDDFADEISDDDGDGDDELLG